MKYFNKASGVTIDVPCPVEGPDWEPVEATPQAPEDQPKPAKKTKTKRT